MREKTQAFRAAEGTATEAILVIETSTALLGAGAVVDGNLVCQRTLVKPRAHSTRLLPLCEEVMKECGVGPASLLAVAVSNGPGSFTGLRIGCSTAQGLAFARGIPVILIPTAEVLARQCSSHSVVAVVQGKAKSQTVTGLYTLCGGTPTAIAPLAPRGMDQFAVEILGLGVKDIHVTGDACLEFVQVCLENEELSRLGITVSPVEEGLRLPSLGVAGEIAWDAYCRGRFVPPGRALPEYYRKSQPEIVMAARERKKR